MPYAPKKPCSQPGCPALTNGGRCSKHKRKRSSKPRPSASKRGYDWKYTVTGLKNGREYWFAVRAADSETPSNEESNSIELSARPLTTLPWETFVVDTAWQDSDWHYMGTSLAFDNTDHPAIAYQDSGVENLKLDRWDGENWDITTVDSAGDVGEFPSLEFDSNGHPAISYRDDVAH